MYHIRFYLLIALVLIIGCDNKQKHFRYNLKVVDDKDSLNNYDIFTDLHEDYNFYYKNDLDSILFFKESLDKVDGKFKMGFINNKHSCNKILFFSSPETNFPYGEIGANRKVMFQEFSEVILPNKSFRLNCYSDTIDSLSENHTRQISFVLTYTSGTDTIGYQENVYVEANNKLVTAILIYTDLKYKNELKEVSQDLFQSKKWYKHEK